MKENQTKHTTEGTKQCMYSRGAGAVGSGHASEPVVEPWHNSEALRVGGPARISAALARSRNPELARRHLEDVRAADAPRAGNEMLLGHFARRAFRGEGYHALFRF